MSKHADQRTEGKYDLQERAKEMAGHTLKLTSNEEKFPKRYRLTVVGKLQEKAIDVYDCLIMAQEIFPNTKREYDMRQMYQKRARASCRSLLSLMEISADVFGIPASSLEHWTEGYWNIYRQITAWTVADQNRFRRFQ